MDFTLFEVNLRRDSGTDVTRTNGAAPPAGDSAGENLEDEFDLQVTDEPPEEESGRPTWLLPTALALVAAALVVTVALLVRRYRGGEDEEPPGVDGESPGVDGEPDAGTGSDEESGSRVPFRN